MKDSSQRQRTHKHGHAGGVPCRCPIRPGYENPLETLETFGKRLAHSHQISHHALFSHWVCVCPCWAHARLVGGFAARRCMPCVMMTFDNRHSIRVWPEYPKKGVFAAPCCICSASTRSPFMETTSGNCRGNNPASGHQNRNHIYVETP